MATTYLELTNQVLRKLNQVELTSSSFASARGIHATAKDGVSDALKKLNTQKFEWPFNSTSGAQTLVVGQTFYNFPIDVKTIDWNSFYIEKNDTFGINTTNLKCISKDEWFKWLRPQDFDVDPSDGRGVPEFVFEYSNRSFGVSPLPNETYSLNYRYFQRYVPLVLFDDESIVPEEYDYVVMAGALHYCYMMQDNDQRSMSQEAMFRQGLNDMVVQLLPKDPYAYSDTMNQNTGNWNYGSGFYWGE